MEIQIGGEHMEELNFTQGYNTGETVSYGINYPYPITTVGQCPFCHRCPCCGQPYYPYQIYPQQPYYYCGSGLTGNGTMSIVS